MSNERAIRQAPPAVRCGSATGTSLPFCVRSVAVGPAGSRLAYCIFSLLAYLEPIVLWIVGGYGASVLLPLVMLPLALPRFDPSIAR